MYVFLKIIEVEPKGFVSQEDIEVGGGPCAVCIKCLFFDDEMCTLQKVGGEDSKGRRVL